MMNSLKIWLPNLKYKCSIRDNSISFSVQKMIIYRNYETFNYGITNQLRAGLISFSQTSVTPVLNLEICNQNTNYSEWSTYGLKWEWFWLIYVSNSKCGWLLVDIFYLKYGPSLIIRFYDETWMDWVALHFVLETQVALDKGDSYSWFKTTITSDNIDDFKWGWSTFFYLKWGSTLMISICAKIRMTSVDLCFEIGTLMILS